jgi:hypothetical protein
MIFRGCVRVRPKRLTSPGILCGFSRRNRCGLVGTLLNRTFSFFKYTLFAIIPTLLVLVILEFSLIALDPWIAVGPWMYDADIGFIGRPHYDDWNSLGFCDKERDVAKDSGVYRVLFLGDSFGTFGGVNENVTAHLQHMLDVRFGQNRVEVINLSVPMTHTGEQLWVLKKYGLRFAPDLVLLGFCFGNDFLDADPYRKRIAFCGSWIDIDKRKEVKVFGRPLVCQSRFYALLNHYIVIGREICRQRFEARDRTSNQAPNMTDPEKTPTFSETAFWEIERNRFRQCDKKRISAGDLKANVDYILASIDEITAMLGNLGVKFVVAGFPDEFQVDHSLGSKLLASSWSTEGHDLLLPQKILACRLEKLGVPFADLTGEFQRQGSRERLYIPRDTHWNQKGRRLAAELMFRSILGEVEPGVMKTGR